MSIGHLSNRFRTIVDYVGKIPILQVSIGVIVGSFFVPWIGILLGIAFFVVVRVLGRRLVWLGFGVAIIGVRMLFISDTLPENHVSSLNGETVMLSAKVTSDVLMKPEKASVVLEMNHQCVEYTDDSCVEWKEIRGKVQTWFPRFPHLKLGDVVIVEGEIREPEDFEDSDKFSYVKYLSEKGVHSIMYRPDITYTGERGMSVLRLMIDFRDALLAKIQMRLPEPHASLLAGMLLGVRQNMPEDFSLGLQRTGTTHIIAASGYNVTLVINTVVAIFSFLHRRMRILVSLACIWGFVVMSGASIPVVRAGIMGSIVLLALLMGSATMIHVSLPLSAAILVLASPGMLSDISFQLSFVSTFGLVYLVPVIKRFLPWIPEGLEESTLVTVAAIIMTFPITAYNFGQISLVAPLANFFVLPVVALAMGLGVCVVAIPLWLKPISILVGTIVWVPLEYFVTVVDVLSSLRWASVEIPGFSGIFAVGMYIVILLVILAFHPGSQSSYLIKDLRI